MGSEVYFAQRRTAPGAGLLEKLEAMCEAAGVGALAQPGDVVAVLTTFGEPGNTTFLRPGYALRVAHKLRQRGASPFLAACLPLDAQRTRHGVDMLLHALRNGFGAGADEVPVVIADGVLGESEVVVPGAGAHLAEARLGAALVAADAVVAVTHVTAHDLCGLGGALMQLGYGAASRQGKALIRGEADDAARRAEPNRLAQLRMVEAAGAWLKGRPGRLACVNVLVDVTPEGDDQGWSDAPFVPDLGVLVSRDPVAIDQASAELIAQAPGLAGTRLADVAAPDKLRALYPWVDWEHQLGHAERLGLGARDHELLIM